MHLALSIMVGLFCIGVIVLLFAWVDAWMRRRFLAHLYAQQREAALREEKYGHADRKD